MNFQFASSLVALTICLTPHATNAQSLDRQGADDPGSDQIVVTANRTSRSNAEVGESVSVITEDEIIERQASDILDLLRTVPGVTFNRSGGIGTNAGISIRGAQNDQTVVLIDGIKLNDPASPGGGFNFGPLMVGSISRIEVVRGSQSVLYGSQAIGGVINLITREPTSDGSVFARADYGSRDTAEVVANISGQLGRVGASIGANYLRTDGISAYNRARGGLESDGFESAGINGKIDVAISSNISLDLRAFYMDGETDIDGFTASGFGDTEEVSRRQDFVGYAGVNFTALDNRFRNRVGFAYTNIDRRNLNLAGGSEVETFDANGENRRLEYQGVLEASDVVEFVFGAEREESEFRASSFGGAPSIAEAWINSIYGQINFSPLEGFSITGGMRFDDHETFGNVATFAASGTYSPDQGQTVIRASYGEGFKAPALFQLFSDFGNPELDPERSDSWDLGVTHSILDGRAELGVTYFERDAANEIVFVGCFNNPIPPCQTPSPPFGTYDNLALSNADGWEIALALQPVDGFDVAINYSMIDAFDGVTANRLPRRAKDTFSLVADYQFLNGLAIGATVFVAGDSFDDAANARALDGYVVADVRMSYSVTSDLEVFGRVENLADSEYETVFGFGQPGRAAFAGVRYRM